jgi:uncharacterized membrane protein YqgA involved in biofilm formation
VGAVIRGTGTALNVATVLIGSGIGVAVRGRLPARSRDTVTDALGLVVFVIAGLNLAALQDAAYRRAVSPSGTVLVVLGAMLLGGIIGSLLRLEHRLDAFGGWLQRRLAREGSSEARARFVEGYVAASLLFVIGPLTILGSLADGLGRGIDQLALKATLDGFAAVAFAASFGWGVAAAALSVGVVQVPVGDMLPALLVAPPLTALVSTLR